GSRGGPVPRGPALPAQHGRDPPAAAARAARGHPAAGRAFPASAGAAVRQAGRGVRAGRDAGADRARLARQRAGAGAHRGTRGAARARRAGPGGGPGSARARAGGCGAAGGDAARGGGEAPDPAGARTLRRQRQPRRAGTRVEPQRALPEAPAVRLMSSPERRPRYPRRRHEQRVLTLALLAGLPGTALGLFLLWTGDFSSRAQWTLTLAVVGAWWGFAWSARERVVRPLQTLSNLLAALREG